MAEAAVRKGLSALTSETHGMAQRGGTVISHLKVGRYTSPLIRTGKADGLLALKGEGAEQHGHYLRSQGWAVVNTVNGGQDRPTGWKRLDADRLAHAAGNPRSVNLVVLGGALSGEGHRSLFCSLEDIRAVLAERLSAKPDLLKQSYKALEAGLLAAKA
jgi:indolepyruvate ferredoxin oxidoreductase beta subunit